MARKRTRKRVTVLNAGKHDTHGKPFKIPKDVEESLSLSEKKHKGTVYRGSNRHVPPRIPTGIFVLDYALLGGIPVNSATMLLGERHAGKSLLSFKLIASAQRQFPDSVCVLVDTERSYDPVWAAKLGVDTDRLFVVEALSGEQAVDQAALFANTEKVSLMVIDSLPSIVPHKEVDDSAEQAHVGLQSRLISSLLRRMTQALINSRQYGQGITLVYVNQFRAKIGGFVMGDPRTPAGGKFAEYHVGLTIIVKNKENKAGGGVTNEHIKSNTHSFTITKNKYNNGPRTGEFVISREHDSEQGLYEGDVDDFDTMLSYAKKWEVFKGRKPNAVISLPDREVPCVSATRAMEMLKEDPDLRKDLRDRLVELEAMKWQMPRRFIDTIGMEDYTPLYAHMDEEHAHDD